MGTAQEIADLVFEHVGCSTPGSVGPKPAWYFDLDAVSETEPYERPWNASIRPAPIWPRTVIS